MRPPHPIPPLPPHLNGMVWKAGAGHLHGSTTLKSGGMIPDVQKYITAWALAYLCRGSKEDALTRLEAVYEVLGPGLEAEVAQEQKPKNIYPIPEGLEPKPCRSCEADVYWIRTEKGKPMPLDEDGTPHFATCPQGKAWSGKSRKEKAA